MSNTRRQSKVQSLKGTVTGQTAGLFPTQPVRDRVATDADGLSLSPPSDCEGGSLRGSSHGSFRSGKNQHASSTMAGQATNAEKIVELIVMFAFSDYGHLKNFVGY